MPTINKRQEFLDLEANGFFLANFLLYKHYTEKEISGIITVKDLLEKSFRLQQAYQLQLEIQFSFGLAIQAQVFACESERWHKQSLYTSQTQTDNARTQATYNQGYSNGFAAVCRFFVLGHHFTGMQR